MIVTAEIGVAHSNAVEDVGGEIVVSTGAGEVAVAPGNGTAIHPQATDSLLRGIRMGGTATRLEAADVGVIT